MGELGSWLIRAREARGLTLEDAERDTRISRRYLQALETEQFEVIPAPVYARGFLRSYSQYLGLDPVAMLGMFPRDEDPAYAAASARNPERPSMQTPISAVGPSRPSWRRPGPSAEPPRKQQREPAPASNSHQEPTIGVDIGAPVPTRRMVRDPARRRWRSSPSSPLWA
jgi:transcriptional regulator with XRE-family HTH domain